MSAEFADCPGARAPQALPLLTVSCAVLLNADNHVLVTDRPAGKDMAGLWEFPGGKVEAHETPGESLVRELEEELGLFLDPHSLTPLAFAESEIDAQGRAIVILLYSVGVWSGEAESREGGAFAWVRPDVVSTYPMPPLDIDLLSRLAADNFLEG